MKNIAIFASGSGTNADAICRYFANRNDIRISAMVCNRKEAGAYERMRRQEIPAYYFPRKEWLSKTDGGEDGANVLALMRHKSIDLIVLAGFLAFIPTPLIDAYPGRIINIHPSLLPKFGGQNMWGSHVHEAVLAANESESGITIHEVTSEIDGGRIIFSAKCEVLPDDTADTLAERIHALEHKYYPIVIDKLLTGDSR